MNHTLAAVVAGMTLAGAWGMWVPGGVATALAQSIPLSPTAQASGAIITFDQGIEFVTIGNQGGAGNAAFNGMPPPGGGGWFGQRARRGRL